jgi:hypothetical protein
MPNGINAEGLAYTKKIDASAMASGVIRPAKVRNKNKVSATQRGARPHGGVSK